MAGGVTAPETDDVPSTSRAIKAAKRPFPQVTVRAVLETAVRVLRNALQGRGFVSRD